MCVSDRQQRINHRPNKMAPTCMHRYQYNGVGETAIWHSSKNYLVVDLSAGPSTYGPLVSQGGAVTPQALPSIKVSKSETHWQW
jgi:hypothetical protein